MKTFKELSKDLNEKIWYRFVKVLWGLVYIVLLILFLIHPKTRSLDDAVIIFVAFTFSYLGTSIFLKRAICYVTDYIITGRVRLREKWYFLLFIVLWGILSISLIYQIIYEIYDF